MERFVKAEGYFWKFSGSKKEQKKEQLKIKMREEAWWADII